MKKILLTALISLGALGLTTTTASAKCNGGDDKAKTEMPAKAESGKCGTGKCGGDKVKEKAETDANKTKVKTEKGKCGTGKCSTGK